TKKGPTAMIVTIAKNNITKAEETVAVEEKKITFCFFHGKDKGHWTNECLFAIERKEEFDRLNSQPAKPVNHISQLPPQSSATVTIWAPMPNWPVSYPVYNNNPLPYIQQAPPSQQIVPILPPPPYSQTWSRSSTPSLMTQQVYPCLRSSSQGRYPKEHARDPPAVGSTHPTNQYLRRRGNAKNTLE